MHHRAARQPGQAAGTAPRPRHESGSTGHRASHPGPASREARQTALTWTGLHLQLPSDAPAQQKASVARRRARRAARAAPSAGWRSARPGVGRLRHLPVAARHHPNCRRQPPPATTWRRGPAPGTGGSAAGPAAGAHAPRRRSEQAAATLEHAGLPGPHHRAAPRLPVRALEQVQVPDGAEGREQRKQVLLAAHGGHLARRTPPARQRAGLRRLGGCWDGGRGLGARGGPIAAQLLQQRHASALRFGGAAGRAWPTNSRGSDATGSAIAPARLGGARAAVSRRAAAGV